MCCAPGVYVSVGERGVCSCVHCWVLCVSCWPGCVFPSLLLVVCCFVSRNAFFKCFFVRAGPNQRVYFGGSVRLVRMRACVKGERTVRVFWS